MNNQNIKWILVHDETYVIAFIECLDVSTIRTKYTMEICNSEEEGLELIKKLNLNKENLYRKQLKSGNGDGDCSGCGLCGMHDKCANCGLCS